LAHAGTHIFVRITHMQDRAQSKIITIYLWATKSLYVSTLYMGMDYTYCLWTRIAVVDNTVDAVRVKRHTYYGS
jgi:hypothetical protein